MEGTMNLYQFQKVISEMFNSTIEDRLLTPDDDMVSLWNPGDEASIQSIRLSKKHKDYLDNLADIYDVPLTTVTRCILVAFIIAHKEMTK